MSAKKALALIKEAPVRPYFRGMAEAVAFADCYDVWFKKVKQVIGE